MQYPAKIDKDIVRELPVAQTDCEIEVIDSANEVATAVDCLMQEEVVGFDTETKPSFTHGKSNKIALMQISTAKKCFLFRLQMIGKSEALKNFLENEKIKKIGLALHGDLRNLRVWDKFTPKNFIDLQKIVIQYGIEELGLQRIYAIIFGKKISKSQQLSNWEAKILNQAQQIYAATDAWACREIYLKLIENKDL
ncbi:MAG: 3'-5' exonuclease [Bacteroidota bacterium]|jgi:3'-5' exonuclease domain protein|nr:3'-5' exonuclease domain protein [Bacteroidetes oral taxon 274 str. F0058]